MRHLREAIQNKDLLKWVAVFFVALAVLSFPIPFVNGPILTFGSTAIFKFTVAQYKDWDQNDTVTYLNGTVAKRLVHIHTERMVGNGTVTLFGKGGLSAGNPIEMTVVVYFLKDTFDMTPQPTIVFLPTGAFAAEVYNILCISIPQDRPQTDAQGIPQDANIMLTIQGDKWTGKEWVIYNQGSSLTPTIKILNSSVALSGPIEIGSEDATLAARTNALLVSLTWVTIVISALELRKK